MNKYNFSERVAIVTGGAQGFGLAITKRIIQSGGKVIVWDIDKEAIEKAQKEIKSDNFNFQIVDVTDFNIIESSIKDLEEQFDKIGYSVRLVKPEIR